MTSYTATRLVYKEMVDERSPEEYLDDIVILTETAAKQFKLAGEGEGKDPVFRIGVRGGGCSGFMYSLDFKEKDIVGDTLFEQYGVTICIDPISAQHLEGTEIDYVSLGLSGSGFKFNNPYAKKTCGCGSSFS